MTSKDRNIDNDHTLKPSQKNTQSFNMAQSLAQKLCEVEGFGGKAIADSLNYEKK